MRLDQIPQTLRFDQGASRHLLRADRRGLFERSPQAEHTHLETHERHIIVLLVRMHGCLIGEFGGTVNPIGVALDPQPGFESTKAQEKTLVRDNRGF